MTYYDVVFLVHMSAGATITLHLTILCNQYKQIRATNKFGKGLMSEQQARFVLDRLRETFPELAFDLRIRAYGQNSK